MREQIRAWLDTASYGALATLHADDGVPFGSLVAFAREDDDVLLWLSDLAVHTKNLRVDGRCSLLVADPAADDPLASWRVTLLGNAIVAGDGARERYFARHPSASLLPGFATWRIRVRSARFIAGFGRMGTVDFDA